MVVLPGLLVPPPVPLLPGVVVLLEPLLLGAVVVPVPLLPGVAVPLEPLLPGVVVVPELLVPELVPDLFELAFAVLFA